MTQDQAVPQPPCVVYSPRYDIRACGLEDRHLFDTRKYSRAFGRLSLRLGESFTAMTTSPKCPLRQKDFLAVHSKSYLARLKSASYLAEILEVPDVERIPAPIVRYVVLRPMRWACAGTLLAGDLAVKHGFAINLSGGYHHAKPDAGEGFCVYSDIALVIHHLRGTGAVAAGAPIAYVDLDAHQGNGVCDCFSSDRSVGIFDMFNRDIYPAHDDEARRRIDCAIPLRSECPTDDYLELLEYRLPQFLDSLARSSRIALLIYNAGTDILQDDPLGQLSVSADAIIRRDLFVARQAWRRSIPFIMLLSGGYTEQSHRVISDSVAKILQENTANWLNLSSRQESR